MIQDLQKKLLNITKSSDIKQYIAPLSKLLPVKSLEGHNTDIFTTPTLNLPNIDKYLSKAEAPTANTPKIDPPVLDLPKFKLPNLPDILPDVDLPKIDLPKIDLPKLDLPKVDLPKISLPNINLPKLDLPKIQLPTTIPIIEPPKTKPIDADFSVIDKYMPDTGSLEGNLPSASLPNLTNIGIQTT